MYQKGRLSLQRCGGNSDEPPKLIKTRKSETPLSLTVSRIVEIRGSTQLLLKPVIGHDPVPVPSTSHFQNLVHKIHFPSSSRASKWPISNRFLNQNSVRISCLRSYKHAVFSLLMPRISKPTCVFSPPARNEILSYTLEM